MGPQALQLVDAGLDLLHAELLLGVRTGEWAVDDDCAGCNGGFPVAVRLDGILHGILVRRRGGRLQGEGVLQRLEGVGALVLVDVGDDVLGKVEDALQVPGREIQEQAQAAGDALGEPDVGDGRGQFYVSHALTPHLGASYLHSAPVADDALVADLLVLPAEALPVLGGAEDALAEEAVLLRP